MLDDQQVVPAVAVQAVGVGFLRVQRVSGHHHCLDRDPVENRCERGDLATVDLDLTQWHAALPGTPW